MMTQIVIDLGEVWADEATAAAAIVNSAAATLIASHDLRSEIRRRVDMLSDKEIVEAIRPLIDDAIAEALQPTDGFGEPTGAPTTLRDVIVARVEKELQQASPSRDTFSRNRESVLDQIVGREVVRVVGDDLRKAMDEARKTVRAAVEAKGAEVLAETINRMARS